MSLIYYNCNWWSWKLAIVMSKIFRSKCFHITFYINFPYSDILIVFSTFSVLESYCSSWALDLRANDIHREHPYLRDQIENSGQKDLRDVKAGQVFVASYQPLMHLMHSCVLPQKPKSGPKWSRLMHFVCFWYCIFTWFSIFTLVF